MQQSKIQLFLRRKRRLRIPKLSTIQNKIAIETSIPEL